LPLAEAVAKNREPLPYARMHLPYKRPR